jgi:hypothetical protein
MKKITPVSVWNDGIEKVATILVASIISDNLESSCTFYYQLCESVEEESVVLKGSALAQGNVAMASADYLAWNGQNDSAYAFVAQELNLTIVAEEATEA